MSGPEGSSPRADEVLRAAVEGVCSIRPATLDLLVGAFLAGLPVLLEDVPGVGKTTVAKALARAARLPFARVQGAPDLLPGDITGMTVWDQESRSLVYRPGPLMSNLVLVDELNRAGTRTQAALLEALEEGQVTVDGVTRPLPRPFFLMATQNPHGFAGTYPLPEATLDRFGVVLGLGYPPDETEVLRRNLETPAGRPLGQATTASLDGAGVEAAREALEGIRLAPVLSAWIVRVIQASRRLPAVTLGLSPRAGIHWARLARALAWMDGRDYVRPGDLERCATEVLSHRLVLDPQARLDGLSPGRVLDQCFQGVPRPDGVA